MERSGGDSDGFGEDDQEKDFKGRNPKRHRSPHSQGHKDYTDFRL